MDETEFYEEDLPTDGEETDESVEDDSDGTEQVDDSEEETEPTEDDPWAWTRDKDPNIVRKTFEKFTQTWDEALRDREEAARLREELSPIEELRKALQEDVGLVRAIESYYENADDSTAYEAKVAALEDRLNQMQSVARVEREVADLKRKTAEEGLPDFDPTELVGFAGQRGLPDLEAAYQLKYAEQIRQKAVDDALNGIKRNAEKKVETRSKSAPPSKPPSVDDLMELSDEEFVEYVRSQRK